MSSLRSFTSFVLFAFLVSRAEGQHLWWSHPQQTNASCLYGEITVLATSPSIYYCGANWHPGEPAGGYCGIQDNSPTERRTIFSIWDTTPTLHPKITEADPLTVIGRFGGEGEGGHSHMVWDWKIGETFHFFVQKKPGTAKDTTDTRYYIFDPKKNLWLHSATINNPNGGKESVATISGGIASFLENFAGIDNEVPRLALYRLWLGDSIDTMKCLTKARGDGMWGTLHDAYFLATGDRGKLEAVLNGLESKYGKAGFAENGRMQGAISDKKIPAEFLIGLKKLPQSAAVQDRPAGKASR